MPEIYDNPEVIFNYEYRSDVRSITKHILKYLWAFVLKFIPQSWSANMVTLIGNIGSLLALITLSFFGASHGPEHVWMFPFAGFCILFYNTMDNVDGQQARRTNSSGPLGEFFDHWLDSFNVYFVPLGILSAFPAIPVSWKIIILLAVLVSSWLTYREIQITKIMFESEISALEIVTLSWLFLFSVGITGYSFWITPIANIQFSPIEIFALITMTGSVITAMKTWFRMRKYVAKEILYYWVSILPISLWVLAMAQTGQSRWFILWGLLIMGAASARMTINHIRVRLFGLKPQGFYLDTFIPALGVLVFTSLQVFVSFTFVYGSIFFMIVFTLSILLAISLQIYNSLKRVKDILGIPLFYHGMRHGLPRTGQVFNKA